MVCFGNNRANKTLPTIRKLVDIMVGRIPQSFIQDVLARTDIVELIQARVALTKRGANYQARCPFHEEKTPSFSVSQEKQFYYCFGCGAHGNAIGFLMAFDRMEFLDALAHLAGQLGMELPQTAAQSSQPAGAQDFYPLLAKVTHYYQQQLRRAPAAIAYLKARGLDGHTAKRFAIGYAPAQWENLLPHFQRDRKIKDQLLTNGLLVKEGKVDRFRGRIMFPIRDIRGRVIAFGGRALGDDLPKYMNSPETPIFHKSNELYGLYEARQQQRQLTQVIIVEGYLDVVSLHQYGITYAVATLGTATNLRHLQKLLRYTNEIIFCFDGDEAGRQAAWKAVGISLPILRDGIHVRFLFLPQGEDPDSLVRKIGQEQFVQHLRAAEELSTVFFKQLQATTPLDSPDGKAQFAKKATGYLNTMPEGLFRELLFKQLAQLLHVEVAELATLRAPRTTTAVAQYNFSTHDVLPPAYLASALLLQQSDLIEHLTSGENLSHIQAPGISLLVKLITLLRQQPQLSTGHLLALWQDADEQQQIAQLATRKLPFTGEGLKLELQGALARLKEQHDDQLAQALIRKAEQVGLTADEKKKLRQLLTNAAKGPI